MLETTTDERGLSFAHPPKTKCGLEAVATAELRNRSYQPPVLKSQDSQPLRVSHFDAQATESVTLVSKVSGALLKKAIVS